MKKTFQLALFALLTAMLLPTGSWAQSQRLQLMRQLKAKSLAQQQESSVLPRQMQLNHYGLTPIPQFFTPVFGARRAPLVAADGTVLFGNLNYANYWQTRQNSFYIFKAQQSDAQFSNITGGKLFSTNGGGIFSADKLTYHLIEYVQTTAGETLAQYAEVDAMTWTTTRTQEVTDLSLLSFDLTRDPQTGKVYGAFLNSARTGYELGVIDFNTLTRTTIGKLSKVVVGLAANRQGQLYAIATDGNLYHVDKQTAELTLVGALGVSVAQYQQSATFSSTKDAIYWTRFDNGRSGLYEVNPSTGEAQLMSNFTSNEQIVSLEEWQAAVEDEAPGKPENLSVDFNAQLKTARISFTVPTTTHDGGEMVGDVEAHILVNGVETTKTTLSVGQTARLTVELQKDGNNSVVVYLSNDAGNGEPTDPIVGFVGNDVPSVDGLTATLAVSQEGVATVSWTVPTTAEHGGYVDPAKLSYRVVRHTEKGEEVAAEALTDAVFDEQLPKETMHVYWYAVEVNYDGKTLTTLLTNKERAGVAYDVPFIATFDTDVDFPLFDVLDLNNDNNTWYWYEMMRCAAISWAESSHNDMLLSPAIRLLPRNIYRISYRIKQLNSEHTEAYKATWGPADADPLTYTNVLEETQELKDYQYRMVETTLNADSAQTIRVAFQALTPTRQGVIYLDDVKVELVAAYDAPAQPSISCVPAQLGQLSTAISITAPSQTAHGDVLSEISEVEITSDAGYNHVFTNVEPGQVLNITDNGPRNGYNTYKVVARNAAGESVAAVQTVYVGYDVPDSPQDILLTDDGDNINLSWQVPGTTGPRGGYVDNTQLVYNIGAAGQSELVAQGISANSYSVKNDFKGDQRLLYYGIQAQNSIGGGNWGLSPFVVVGDSYELPFRESFPGQNLNYPFWLINDQNASIASDLAQDGDDGAMVLQSATADQIVLTSGKINIAKAKSPVLTYHYALMPSQSKLHVGIMKDGAETTEVSLVDFSQIPSAGGDVKWSERVVVPLGDYQDAHYVQLVFTVENDKQGMVAFDNIRIEDRYAKNVALTQLDVPQEAAAGDTLTATVGIQNLGYETIREQAVSLSLNGQTVGTKLIDELTTDARQTLTFRVPVTAATQSPATIIVEAPLEDDADQEDNLQSANVKVTTVDLPTVTDLSGSMVDGQPNTVELTWSRPDYTEPAYLTDDMEQYELWTYDMIGHWSTFNDNPGWATASLMEGEFPYMGEEFTAIVFDPSVCDAKTAHSGKQCIAIFDNDGWAGDYGSNCEYTNKYLISPELSGEAQTVTFYVSSAVEWAPETFEVVYSTTSDYCEDLTNVAYSSGIDAINSPGLWQEVSVDLPAGAKYFAIHCTSTYSYALLVDDITYAPKQANARQIAAATNSIEGYNIYLNGQRINQELVRDTRYVTTFTKPEGEYQVSTVYTRGEAGLSNAWNLNVLGIRQVGNGQVRTASDAIYNLQGQRLLQKQRGVVIVGGRKIVVK